MKTASRAAVEAQQALSEEQTQQQLSRQLLEEQLQELQEMLVERERELQV